MHRRPLSHCLKGWIDLTCQCSVKLGLVLVVKETFGARSPVELSMSVNQILAYLARPTHLILLLILVQTRQICSSESVRNFFFVALSEIGEFRARRKRQPGPLEGGKKRPCRLLCYLKGHG